MRNGFWLGLVLLAVHLAVCGGIWLLAWAKVLEVEGYFAPVMLFVPLWGPLCVLLLHTSNRLTGGCLREQTLEKLHINEEIHKSILAVAPCAPKPGTKKNVFVNIFLNSFASVGCVAPTTAPTGLYVVVSEEMLLPHLSTK